MNNKTLISVSTRFRKNEAFFIGISNSLCRRWAFFWAKYSSMSIFGRLASRLAYITAPRYKAGAPLANVARSGYFIAPSAYIYHSNLLMGKNVYISDRVILYQGHYHKIIGGEICIGDGVRIMQDTIIETGQEASIQIGDKTYIHPRCQINAYKSSIEIGKNVNFAPNCAIYSYNHEAKANKLFADQPLTSEGPVIIEDGVGLSHGVIVLSGVRIGKGTLVGAGSIVTKDIPENCIACGSPAKKIRDRI